MVVIDPEGAETDAMDHVGAEITGARVLEVGCGDGRLTWRYAARAASVLGIDPDAEEIALARAATPPGLRGRVEFRRAGIESPDAPPGSFDVVVMAWSL